MNKLIMGLIAAVAVMFLAMAVWVGYLSQTDRSLARREAAWHQRIQPGDVVLQDLACGLRCDLVRDVTHTRYTHVGLVLDQGGETVVWEAMGPVASVPLADWIDRGKQGRVAVYRPNAPIGPYLAALEAAARAAQGKPFDADFAWGGPAYYPSELVARLFDAAGIPVVGPHPLGKDGWGTHARSARGLSHGALTDATPVVMPVDFARAPTLHRVVDELQGAP